MQSPQLPFNQPFIIGKELSYIAEAVMVNAHISGDGPFTRKCQTWIENHLRCQKVLLTHSCTAALEMAALLTGIEAGDEVIMPSFTFVSTANAFVLRGAVPVFVDIRADSFNLDEERIEDAITPKTKAIVPVHYAGVACNMQKITQLAQTYNLIVIEDAAQAFLSKYQDRYLGTLGQLGCFSFHETKNIISGEGGALLINDEHYLERAEYIREKGTDRNKFFRGETDKYTWVDLGSSYIPSDIIAAFLYAQLDQAETIIEKRNQLFSSYTETLRPLEQAKKLRLPVIEQDSTSNGHIFYFITRSPEERTALIQHLANRNIHAVFHYIPLHSSPAGRKFGRTQGTLQVTEDLSRRILRLPLFYEMTPDDVQAVCQAVFEFYESPGFSPIPLDSRHLE